MDLTNPARLKHLTQWIQQIGAYEQVDILEARVLDGGAIQQNWLIRIQWRKNSKEEEQALVLRTDSIATISESRSRKDEYRILEAAFHNGVKVPRPIGFCDDPGVLGQTFSLVEMVEGIGFGPKVVKHIAAAGNGDSIVTALAKEMAKIHAIDPTQAGLDCIDTAEKHHALAEIQGMTGWLDQHRIARPILEWGLRWVNTHLPAQEEPVFLHRDFRTGNIMVNEDGLGAILDWEFSGYGDPMSDIGWFCAECWRFSRPDLEAGGLAGRNVFYETYESASGRTIDHNSVFFWEVIAHLRWAVIALQQGNRHLSGDEPSLPMAITSRIVDQLELILMRMTAQPNWQLHPDTSQISRKKPSMQTDVHEPHQSFGADLLSIARAALSDGVLPKLPASDRLTALMVNNAVGIVEREITHNGNKTAAEQALLNAGGWGSFAELATIIRQGDLDDNQQVWKKLTALAAIQSEIFKPGFATQEELEQ